MSASCDLSRFNENFEKRNGICFASQRLAFSTTQAETNVVNLRKKQLFDI